MTDFNLGDLVEVQVRPTGGAHEGTVIAENMDGSGERLVLLHENGNSYTLDTMLEDTNLDIVLVKPIADRLPSTPGQYNEIPSVFVELAKIIGVDPVEEYGEVATGDEEVWTLNEDGTWTDHTGLTKGTEFNWILAASGSLFVPVA